MSQRAATTFGGKLPPFSATTSLLMLYLTICRDHHGSDWCLAEGIGAMRKHLGLPPEGVILMPTGVAENDERSYGEIAQSERVMLSEACRRCQFDGCVLRHR